MWFYCRHSKVAFLECDVGQTEFTPSGLVSLTFASQPLIGKYFLLLHILPFNRLQDLPVHTNNLQKGLFGCIITTITHWFCVRCLLHLRYRAFFIGDSSPMQQPDLYISSINSLMQYFISQGEEMPLIVNTCGWLKGWLPYSPTQHACNKSIYNCLQEIHVPTRDFLQEM